jgi:hypothetical protein
MSTISSDEPEAVKLLRGQLSKRATSAEFNEWQAREVVAYIDSLLSLRESHPIEDGEGWIEWKGDKQRPAPNDVPLDKRAEALLGARAALSEKTV